MLQTSAEANRENVSANCMKNKLYILFILTTTIVCGQNGRYQPYTDAQKVCDTIPLTFNQKLKKCTNFNPNCISFKYNNLDTVNGSLSFNLEFLFSEKALKILLNDLLGDTISEKIPISKNIKIETNKIKLENVSGMNFLYSESNIDINTINGNTINKTLPILVFLKSADNSPILDMYVDLSNGIWYYFFYYKNVMSAVSSNQNFNSTLTNAKSSNRQCYYSICSPTKRDIFIRKLELIKETTRH